MITLREHQQIAIKKITNGSILCGGVGSGKSITSIAYYYLQNGGIMDSLVGGKYIPMPAKPRDLYIITTARKRDQNEWEFELNPFLLSVNPEINKYANKVVVDSWNNIKKYKDVTNAFFIFDEQRVVGSGEWVKAFLKITKVNDWILLSATPGDTWEDYIPVFIANGFYKNKTEFINEHVVYSRFSKFPKIDRYLNTGRLIRLRERILIPMEFVRETIPHHQDIYTKYDKQLYKRISGDRWNIWDNVPIVNASELCYSLRKLVNSDPSRQDAIYEIMKKRQKAIIFYNFNYELDILKDMFDCTNCEGNGLCERQECNKCYEVAEWNGHKHQPIPTSDRWVYLVQYTAGAEGWNCIKTDTIIFFSQNYSYKVMIQSSGRIDRLNTPYRDLYYYHLKSHSSIDMAISRALRNKKKFNETKYASERK